MIINSIQFDRHNCEVPNCTNIGTDWDHCIFKKNKRFKKYVNNPLNMLRACANCNRITHQSDRWTTKKWLIDHNIKHYREEFKEWFESWPNGFHPNDEYVVYNYIKEQLEKETI